MNLIILQSEKCKFLPRRWRWIQKRWTLRMRIRRTLLFLLRFPFHIHNPCHDQTPGRTPDQTLFQTPFSLVYRLNSTEMLRTVSLSPDLETGSWIKGQTGQGRDGKSENLSTAKTKYLPRSRFLRLHNLKRTAKN